MAVRKRVTVSQIAKKMAKRTRMAHADLTFILHMYCEEVQKAIIAEKEVYLADVGTLFITRGKQTIRSWETGVVSTMENYPKMRFKMSSKMRNNFRRILVGRWRRENPLE